jgi:hypothetical protein
MYVNIESAEHHKDPDTGEWHEAARESFDKIFLAKARGRCGVCVCVCVCVCVVCEGVGGGMFDKILLAKARNWGCVCVWEGGAWRGGRHAKERRTLGRQACARHAHAQTPPHPHPQAPVLLRSTFCAPNTAPPQRINSTHQRNAPTQHNTTQHNTHTGPRHAALHVLRPQP